MKIGSLALALALSGAVGCSQEAPPAPNDAASTPPAAAAPTAAKQVQPPIGDAMFSIDPGSFRTCDAVDGAITSTAKWDVDLVVHGYEHAEHHALRRRRPAPALHTTELLTRRGWLSP